MKKWGILVFFLLPVLASAQIITNFAGTGSSVFSGNGIPATAAGIPNPTGLVFDKYGNCYLGDWINSYRIRKISSGGGITTIGGTGVSGYNGTDIPATAAKIGGPLGITLDTLGNIYFADNQNHIIRKIDVSTNIIRTIAGTTSGFSGDGGIATSAQLYNPQDVRIDKHGNVYIADLWNNRIRKVDAAGIITTIAGGGTGVGDNGPATAAQLISPYGLALDDSGNVYIAETASSIITNRVRKVNVVTGIITTIAGNGSSTYAGDGVPATAVSMSPRQIAFDTSGQLYISDLGNNRIYRIDHSGILHLVAGNGTSVSSGDGGPATGASIWDPGGITFDPCSNLYIGDLGGRRIRKVTFNPTCNMESLKAEVVSTGKNVSVYPNPAKDELHIENIKPNTEYKLYNVVGAVMQQGVLPHSINTISIQHLPHGLYLLALTDGEGMRTVHKIVKE